MATIREQFIEAVKQTLAWPANPDPEVQKSMDSMALRMATNWIEGETMEFRLFKKGHFAGRAEMSAERNRSWKPSMACDVSKVPQDSKGDTYTVLTRSGGIPPLPSGEDE